MKIDTQFGQNMECCALHPTVMTSEDATSCDGCKQEMAVREAAFEQTQAEARTRGQGLAQLGLQVPGELIMAVRLETMIDALFTDPRQRIMFETIVGKKVVDWLKEQQANLAKQSKLIVPKNGAQVKSMLKKNLRG